MRITTLIGIIVLIFSLFVSVSAHSSPPPPSIEINDETNQVKYHEFDDEDGWHIIIRYESNNSIAYDLKGNFSEGDFNDRDNAFIEFDKNDNRKTINRCIFPGEYLVSAYGTHNGIEYSKLNVHLSLSERKACCYDKKI